MNVICQFYKNVFVYNEGLYYNKYTKYIQQMTAHLNISLSDELKEIIDKKRGHMPISIFVRLQLAKALGVSEEIALSERERGRTTSKK